MSYLTNQTELSPSMEEWTADWFVKYDIPQEVAEGCADAFNEHGVIKKYLHRIKGDKEKFRSTLAEYGIKKRGVQDAILDGLEQEDLASNSSTQLEVGEYELLSPIGQGAFGQVWKAKDRKGKIVAIKKMIQVVDDIFKELEALQKLEHPNIIPIISFYSDPNKYPALVMEFYEMTLTLFLKERHHPGSFTKLEASELMDIFKQTMEGVEYLHSQLIGHRDIKPDNILVNVRKDGKIDRLVLSDFGTVKQMSEQTLTTETIAGTPLFLAPEVRVIILSGQVIGTNAYQPLPADIYSVGRMIPILLTGKIQSLVNIAKLGFPEIQNDDGFFKHAYTCCTQEDSRARPSANDVLDGIDFYLGGELQEAKDAISFNLNEVLAHPETNTTEPLVQPTENSINSAQTWKLMLSEREYVNDLQVVVRHYLDPLRLLAKPGNPWNLDSRLSGVESFKNLFGELQIILGYHTILLKDLEGALTDSDVSGLDKVFFKFLNYLKIYSNYCSTYMTLDMVDLMKSHPEIQEVSKIALRQKEVRYMTLDAYLSKPLQRIPQYLEIFKEVRESLPEDSPRSEIIDKILDHLHELVKRIADASHREKKNKEVLTIQDNIESLPVTCRHRVT
eukprot:TRINITY_DN1809_c0_g1_i3.p1 TRINITY_DN1809_c0_g1~~TRINITY_DN1809_c0_g1_i3.p1  ORF type:complete len:617 (-),score=196.28 TRINITY_DN1809_c0_g1_i3:439-2289(-)